MRPRRRPIRPAPHAPLQPPWHLCLTCTGSPQAPLQRSEAGALQASGWAVVQRLGGAQHAAQTKLLMLHFAGCLMRCRHRPTITTAVVFLGRVAYARVALRASSVISALRKASGMAAAAATSPPPDPATVIGTFFALHAAAGALRALASPFVVTRDSRVPQRPAEMVMAGQLVSRCLALAACLAAVALGAAPPAAGAQLVRWGGPVAAAVPEPVESDLPIASIQANDYGACGLLTNGSAFCIDVDLSDPASEYPPDVLAAALPPPMLVPGGYAFATLVMHGASDRDACGLLLNGSALW